MLAMVEHGLGKSSLIDVNRHVGQGFSPAKQIVNPGLCSAEALPHIPATAVIGQAQGGRRFEARRWQVAVWSRDLSPGGLATLAASTRLGLTARRPPS